MRFVSVDHRRLGHARRSNFDRLKTKLLPELDAGLAGLFNAL